MKRMMVVGCCLLAGGLVFADRVELKSGTVLTGKILGLEGDKVKIATDELGEIAVPTNAVVRHVVPEGRTMPGVAAIAPIPKPPETWHGSIHIGYQGSRGNTYENSGSVMLHLDRRWENDRFNGDFGYYYSKSGQADEEARKTTDRWEAELKHDHFWTKKVYHFEDLRFDRDMIQLLRARYRVGLGGGYQWLEKTEFATGLWSFNQELGVNWIKEDYEKDTVAIALDDDDDKKWGFCALKYAHHLTWLPKWVEGMEVFHNAEILPDVSEWEKFLAKADLGFSTKLFLNFDLLAKIEWEYNSKPASDRKKDDFRFIIGLGYKW